MITEAKFKYPLILVLSLVTLYFSCKKNQSETVDTPKNENHLLNGKIVAKTQSWLELRDQAKREFEFHFGKYYHTRDFLGNVDWDHAILYEMDGSKIMIFLFQTIYSDKIEAKLMVKQGDEGRNIYMIRVRSTDSKRKYASIYTATDKVLHLGSIVGNVFNELGSTNMQSSTMMGGWPDACNSCHSGNSGGNGGWGDPVPGGGDIFDNNWLGEVVIQENAVEWNWSDWDDFWDGPVIVIPGGGDVPTQTVDNDPCATFDALMLNQSFRQKLMELVANTALDHETAFTYDGTTSSPFAYGPVGGDEVTISVSPSDKVWAHSHYVGKNPTFSNWDIQSFYMLSQNSSNPMGFVGVVANNPCGISMIKITDMNKFNTFYNNYLNSQSGLDMLGGLMTNNGAGPNGGSNASNALNTLLNGALMNAGLKVSKVYDCNNPPQPCN